MSKYIIDTGDLGINPVKVLIIGEGAYKEKYVDDLEEFNDDYIRKEYRELPTEAYKRGYDYGLLKGKHDAEQDMYDKGYQKGFEEGKGTIHKDCEGCLYEGKVVTGPPCITCGNSYRNQWVAKKQDDEIKVGDVVRWKDEDINDGLAVITWIGGKDGKQCNVMCDDGSCGAMWNTDEFVKTGRHVDITGMLKGALE